MSLAPEAGWSQDYAITITLKPFLYKESLESQYDKLWEEVDKMYKFSACWQQTIVVEVTKSFNIHAHGFIKVRNSRNALRTIYDFFRKNASIGFVYVKPVECHNTWLEYVLKDIKKTYDTLYCRRPIMIDQFDYITEIIYYELFDKSLPGTDKATVKENK